MVSLSGTVVSTCCVVAVYVMPGVLIDGVVPRDVDDVPMDGVDGMNEVPTLVVLLLPTLVALLLLLLLLPPTVVLVVSCSTVVVVPSVRCFSVSPAVDEIVSGLVSAECEDLFFFLFLGGLVLCGGGGGGY